MCYIIRDRNRYNLCESLLHFVDITHWINHFIQLLTTKSHTNGFQSTVSRSICLFGHVKWKYCIVIMKHLIFLLVSIFPSEVPFTDTDMLNQHLMGKKYLIYIHKNTVFNYVFKPLLQYRFTYDDIEDTVSKMRYLQCPKRMASSDKMITSRVSRQRGEYTPKMTP